MADDGIVRKYIAGRSKATLSMPQPPLLADYLKNHFGISNLPEYISLLEQEEQSSRAEAITIASDSKLKSTRAFKGFLLNCIEPVACTLYGKPYTVQPQPGTFTFLYDYEDFLPDQNVTIVGIENFENFRFVEQQAELFAGKKVLFVSRYPQSSHLVAWLKAISNPYLHFGDIDLAGINIYLNEFKKHLGSRAGFFVPPHLEKFLSAYGSRELYNRQLAATPSLDSIDEPGLAEVLALIYRYKKGLEQEVFIG